MKILQNEGAGVISGEAGTRSPGTCLRKVFELKAARRRVRGIIQLNSGFKSNLM